MNPMLSILAIDSSTDTCSVALSIKNAVYDCVSYVPREHTQRLLPMVESLLAQHQLTLSQLDAIAFGAGPGSFTGLRICLSVAQGLAYGADLPLIPVSSLKAMANGAIRRYQIAEGSIVIPSIDARMDEIYWSMYSVRNHSLHPLSEEQVSSPAHCAQTISVEHVNDTIYGFGSGWHYQPLQSLTSHTVEQQFFPMAHDVAALAVPAFAQGESVDALAAQPEYLRNEINWQKRNRIRQ
ncbi:MAG: tRNA (adenosine(37)-N6)-threonylcarbamoyltransferase complex dimerization subunit type 1 TsaB [Pseudomonadota bacterium]